MKANLKNDDRIENKILFTMFAGRLKHNQVGDFVCHILQKNENVWQTIFI
jgi:hypothetical protein